MKTAWLLLWRVAEAGRVVALARYLGLEQPVSLRRAKESTCKGRR